ncbi:MlaD family protein [Thermodesulfovibrionales bacterium]|nr:MlaD family protein [Thermodesulfovibrionales bacterium]
MRYISAELKVGIFALIALGILAFMAFKVGELDWLAKKGYTVYAHFNYVGGLTVGADVRVAGMVAGRVDDITLKTDKVRLRLFIHEGVRIYSDAVVSLKIAGMLGERIVEISPGSKLPLLQDGDTIVYSLKVADIDMMLRDISELSTEISRLAASVGAITEPEETRKAIKASIRNLEELTYNMNIAVVYNNKKLRVLLGHMIELIEANKEMFGAVMADIEEFSLYLKREGPILLESTHKAVEEIKTVVEENRVALKRSIEAVDEITDKIGRGEGTLGRLWYDEAIYESAHEAIEDMTRIIETIEEFEVFTTFRGGYLTGTSGREGHLYLTLKPTPKFYYILGVVSGPGGLDGDREIEFSAQFARRFKDSDKFRDSVLRAGITENTFGIGADQFFLDDRLKFSADVWDLFRNERGTREPHVRLGIDYFIFENMFISGGVDDIFNEERRGAYVGGGVKFRH